MRPARNEPALLHGSGGSEARRSNGDTAQPRHRSSQSPAGGVFARAHRPVGQGLVRPEHVVVAIGMLHFH